MTTYVFDADEMREVAGVLRRALDPLGEGHLALLMVSADGLPPEAAARVESQCRALGTLVFQAADSLRGGARMTSRMATAVDKADTPALRAAGLDLVRVAKGGAKVFRELSDKAYRQKVDRYDRATRWAGLLGAITGEKKIDQAVSWSDWRKAMREAKVDPRSSAARRLSALLHHRANRAFEDARDLDRRVQAPPPFDPEESKSKRWARRFTGYLPGPAGDTADLFGYLNAGRKFRHDEPQTGVSQVATDVRDFVDLVGASNHLAADALFKSPLTAPAGVINESVALGADGVVLGLDTLNEGRKAVESLLRPLG